MPLVLLLLLLSFTSSSSFSSSTHPSVLPAAIKDVHEDDAEGKYAWICSGLQSLKCVCLTVKEGEEEDEDEEEERGKVWR
jgi:hypothetical protein